MKLERFARLQSELMEAKARMKVMEEQKNQNSRVIQTALTGEETWKQEAEKLRRMYEELKEELKAKEEKLADANEQLKRFSSLIDQAVLIEASGANPIVISDQRQKEAEERLRRNFNEEKSRAGLEVEVMGEELKKIRGKYDSLQEEVMKKW